MKKYICFLLVLLVTACAAPLSEPAIQLPVVENTALPTQPIQFTPIPTFTAEVLPTIQPTADFPTFTPPTELPSGQSNEIRFAANGTYVDVADFIATGASKTYIVNAMKGQIMSVSVLPQANVASTILMQVRGADGTVLCPQPANEQCLFWRGILPASQDYFVTLTPDGISTQFVLRVAINPPGKAVQLFQYTNSATGFSLTYPDFFAPALPVSGNYKITPELTLGVIDSPFYENTNLSEAYVFVGSTSEAQVVATCAEPNQTGGAPEQLVGNEVFNGYTFVHSTSEGVAAGNSYQQEIYRMARSGVCYEVILYLHSTNVGNYPDGAVTEFDRNGIIERFYGVFSTFAIR